MTVFIRVLETPSDQKPSALLLAVKSIASAQVGASPTTLFFCDPTLFARIPGSPFAYWVSTAIRGTFAQFPALESQGRKARITNPLSDNFRFARLWFEVPKGNAYWVPWAKGGAYSPYFADVTTVVGWDEVRGTYRGGYVGTSHRPLTRPASADLFFRAGLTWPCRTNGLSVRVLPRGCVFGQKGPAAFVEHDSSDELFALLSVVNSRAFGYLVRLQLARTELAQSYEVGLIQQTPVPNLSPDDTIALGRLARRAWSLKRSLDTSTETSHAFVLPPGLAEKVTGLDRVAVERELESTQKRIDEAAFALYGIGADDRAAIQASYEGSLATDTATDGDDEEGESASEDEAPIGGGTDAFYSWLVGVSFARFDPRLATGERPVPPEPEPFDPLPPRSAGMYPEGEEPADRPDILVDDEGHADDVAARALAVVEHVRVDVTENLRTWLAKEFFPLHIRMYSKSRRKAPVYWQLATPSASYSIWLYIHAFSKDTLFRVQNDYAAPKLAHEERRLESLTNELRAGATAAQRKALVTQENAVEELRAFLDEVKRVTPLWNPNLDDGVVINFAPLWRLVPQNKSWQKELKSSWAALCEGKYDWAHLAMHLWPERVVPKCAKDRSLAIAHGLEDVFWVEGSDGKWTARKTPTRSIDDLVRERTSPAVKAALKSLLEAPTATGNGRGAAGRRRMAEEGESR